MKKNAKAKIVELNTNETKAVVGGASAIEYGLIAAVIAKVIITSVSTLGTTLNGKFTGIKNSLT